MPGDAPTGIGASQPPATVPAEPGDRDPRFASDTAAAARTTKVVDLVLEGGGVRGIALAGAIAVLEEHQLRIARVAGASAGAIVGSLVAAGMPAAELYETMMSLDYRRFLDETELGRIPLIGHGLSLLRESGLYAGDYLRGLLAEHLADLGVRTFGDLRDDDPGSDLPEDRRYKLLVMVSDVSRGRLLRLPWDYGPCLGLDADEQPVADAVQASMSIPFFFQPVKLDVGRGDPSVLVDGGLLSNFPVDAFDRTDGLPPRWPTIGIKLVAEHEPNEVRHRVDGDLSLALAILHTMQGWHDELRLSDPDVKRRTIFVDTFGVKATDFDVDRATQQRLYESGRAAAEAFLDEDSDG